MTIIVHFITFKCVGEKQQIKTCEVQKKCFFFHDLSQVVFSCVCSLSVKTSLCKLKFVELFLKES